jgi:ABC-type nickel/cobalt efflux system permease component RcnA
MIARRIAAALILGPTLALALSATALGHPLGNYTVNRAVAVGLGPEAVAVRYVIDMAEIPAFAALQAIDVDADGTADPSELDAWADRTCAAARGRLELSVDDEALTLVLGADPSLNFPAGAGGLETLRLVCPFNASWQLAAGTHHLSVADRTDDGHVGWRELTIAAGGLSLLASDVPAISPTKELTTYPTESLAAPIDVRSATASFRLGAGSAQPATEIAPPARPRSTSNDPFAALIAGELTLPVVMLAVFLAAGLGAVHALSPGHGKTLVTAYLIGSRGTLRQAAGLGLTVALTHTLGVFALGSITLVAGEFFVPERLIAWLSVVSGGVVALLGLGLVWHALRPSTERAHPRAHDHEIDHHHHVHSHPQVPASTVSVRGLVALGLAGGMVPSASALIVLLAAVSTGRLIFGIGLIVAFGVGMAAVLAGLAAAITMARRVVVAPVGIGSWPLVTRAAGLLPIASGIAVLAIGGVVTIAALARIG